MMMSCGPERSASIRGCKQLYERLQFLQEENEGSPRNARGSEADSCRGRCLGTAWRRVSLLMHATTARPVRPARRAGDSRTDVSHLRRKAWIGRYGGNRFRQLCGEPRALRGFQQSLDRAPQCVPQHARALDLDATIPCRTLWGAGGAGNRPKSTALQPCQRELPSGKPMTLFFSV